MTSKSNKFSLGVKIASVLSCLALTAVGFASWLVIKPADPVERMGAFEVYTVDENNITIAVTPAEGSVPAIVWGKDGEPESEWLLANGVADQSLSATFNVTVTSSATGEATAMNLDDIISGIKVDFAFADKTAYSAALAAGYVAAPTIKLASRNAVTWSGAADANLATDTIAPTADVTTMTFQVVVTFAWGANGNPYTYYNGLEWTKENAEAAVACLEAIEALDGDSYTLTVSTVALAN